jgi:hypothetical protein
MFDLSFTWASLGERAVLVVCGYFLFRLVGYIFITGGDDET